MHKEMMESVSSGHKRVLQSLIPYSSIVERMGVEREPVTAFSPKSVAAEAYQNLWAEISSIVFD
jgi:cellulose biosynthesis protein BcsQ